MSRKFKALLQCWVVATTLFIIIVVVRQIPTWVKSTVEKEPGVKVNHLSFTLDGIHLDLTVDRGWVAAELPDVRVAWDQRVVVRGGQVDLRRLPLPASDPRPETGKRREIRLENLTVRYEKDVQVVVEGVSSTRAFQDPVTWKSATVEHPHAKIVAGPGRAGPAKADPVVVESFSLTPRIKIPHMADGAWTFEDVRLLLEKETLHVGKVAAGSSVGFEVKNATVSRSEDTRRVFVEAEKVVLRHPVVARTPLTFRKHLFSFPVDDVEAVKKGDVNLFLQPTSGPVGSPDIWVNPARMQARSNRTRCQAWVDVMPPELREPLDGLTFTGDVEWHVKIKPDPYLMLRATCRAKCDSPKLTALRKPFTYMAYRPDGVTRFERTSGPGSKDWVPIGAMGQYLPTAAICLEDPGFLVHGGVSAAALRNSLVDNVDKGRFVRGGSTIAMQLARNLWLGRGKTLGRKAQEMFLAWALTSCFTRDQILELYLNVVEFGPDTYGIAAGSQLWFDRHADALSAPEAFYLIKRLPRPGSYPPPDDPTMERITGLMRLFVETKKIPGFWIPQDVSGLDLSGWNQ